MKMFLVFAAALCCASLCFADITIVQKVESGSIMGQPAQNTVQTMKIKGSKARIDQQNQPQYQILDLAAKKMYMVDPQKKETMVMGLEMMEAAGAMFQAMNQNSQLSVKETGNKKTVNGFNCSETLITMTGAMAFTSTNCYTQDIDSTEFEAFRPFSEGMMKTFLGDKGMTKLPKGVSVRSDTNMTMMGQQIKASTEMISVSKEALPDSLFAPPADFKLKEMTMPKMQ